MSMTLVWYFLDKTGKMLLSENLLIVAVVIWTVKGHFKRLELGLSNVATQVKDLSTALLGVETRHTDRLNVIEKRVEKLEEHTTQRRSAVKEQL